MMFFACDSDIVRIQGFTTDYFIKNTSNQTINFELTVIKDELIYVSGKLTSDSVFTCQVNANDSIIISVLGSNWEDLKNHPNWFTEFKITPLDGIQMNDPYLPENWVEYKNPFSSSYKPDESIPAYSFTLNKDEHVPFKHCECESFPDFSPRLLDIQYLEKYFYVNFFIDTIPLNMLGTNFEPHIIYYSKSDETYMYGNRIIGEGWELPGLGKICNLPDFAKEWIVPENGIHVYIEGSMYECSCWGSVGSVFSFDYVLTEFTRSYQLAE